MFFIGQVVITNDKLNAFMFGNLHHFGRLDAKVECYDKSEAIVFGPLNACGRHAVAF